MKLQPWMLMMVVLGGCARLPEVGLPDSLYDIFKTNRTATGKPARQGNQRVDQAAQTLEQQRGDVVATPAMPPALARIGLMTGEPTVPFTIVQHLEATIDPAKINRAPTHADGELLLRALAARANADAVIRVNMDGDPAVRGGLRVRGRAVRYLGQ